MNQSPRASGIKYLLLACLLVLPRQCFEGQSIVSQAAGYFNGNKTSLQAPLQQHANSLTSHPINGNELAFIPT